MGTPYHVLRTASVATQLMPTRNISYFRSSRPMPQCAAAPSPALGLLKKASASDITSARRQCAHSARSTTHLALPIANSWSNHSYFCDLFILPPSTSLPFRPRVDKCRIVLMRPVRILVRCRSKREITLLFRSNGKGKQRRLPPLLSTCYSDSQWPTVTTKWTTAHTKWSSARCTCSGLPYSSIIRT
jgi:hypothetical protein